MRDQPARDADRQEEQTRKRESPELSGGVPGTLSAQEAARLLGIDVPTARPAIGSGELTATKQGGSFHIKGEDRERYRQRRARPLRRDVTRRPQAHALPARRPPSSDGKTSWPRLPYCCGVTTCGSSPSPVPAAVAAPDQPRARGAAAGGGRTLRQGDRGGSRHLPRHRLGSRGLDPRQARHALPRRRLGTGGPWGAPHPLTEKPHPLVAAKKASGPARGNGDLCRLTATIVRGMSSAAREPSLVLARQTVALDQPGIRRCRGERPDWQRRHEPALRAWRGWPRRASTL